MQLSHVYGTALGSMASGIVRAAITVVLEDKRLVSSPLSDAMRTFGTTLLLKVSESDHEIELFDLFCQRLSKDIGRIFRDIRYDKRATKASLWSAFHDLRRTQLPKHWQDLFHGLCREREFLVQCVNQELFQQKLANTFAEKSSQKKTAEQQGEIPADELNAMQYACGYVPFKLLKKYEGKNKEEKSKHFLDCLGNMAVVSEEHDPDLLSYTRLWFETVNRGGLFPLNDETLSFFTEIEKLVRVILPKHMVKADSTNSVKEVTKAIVGDDEVQFKWTFLSIAIDSEEEAQELLHEIVQLWVTVRGFSIAASWMETYKQATKQTKQKSTGLRKHLS